ncbi:MAG: hypothetical protein OEW15_06575 [Nitrospirota bacterium]|nr:hypothetical protein [Nitrospirota bacterium]
MANLFWKRKGNKTLNLLSTPFDTEEAFEKVIFESKEILEDIILIKRQIRGGKKAGIPDIIGIDSEGNVCIIEMKNVSVNSSIIPQVLAYGIWAQKNPDSIKNLWLEAPRREDEVEVNWDNYDVRVIIIAPSIERSTLELINTINYKVDLIEIKRWVEGSNHFLLVNKLEPEQSKKTAAVKGLETYDRAFYEKYRNKNSVKAFLAYAEETGKLVKKKGWPLEMKYNKNYCGFKHGFFNAFGIHWIGSKSFSFFFKLPKSVAEKNQPKGIKMDKYSEQWKQAEYKIDPGKTKVKAFSKLFERAMESVSSAE